MTLGELRELLEESPDDANVIIDTSESEELSPFHDIVDVVADDLNHNVYIITD